MERLLIVFLALVVLWLLVRLYSVHVYRFYSPGCGFCKSSQNDWNRFKQKCMFKMVICHDINMEGSNQQVKELFSNMGGNGVPHIVKVNPNGTRYIYQGDRTVRDLEKWI